MINAILNRLNSLYAWLYGLLCGSYPTVRPWHYQWCALHALNADLRETLPLLEGRVLVVGRDALASRAIGPGVHAVVTVDVAPGPGVTLVVQPNAPWPLPSASFDALLCVDALATLPDPEHAVAEMARLLRQGGLAVMSAPALVANRAILRSYSSDGLRALLGGLFTLTALRRTGGIGSTLVLLLLGWLEALAQQSTIVRLLQFFFLPLWVALCGALNLGAVLVDAVDHTHVFYLNVLVVVVRKAEPLAAGAGSSE